MLGQPKTIDRKKVIKFTINHKIIKLPARKALPLPVLSLQNESELFKCRLKSEKYIDSKLNASLNFKKMLKIIDGMEHLQRDHIKSSQSRISINNKNCIRKQRMESNLLLSKTMLQQEIESTIRRHNFKKREDYDQNQIKIFRSKMSRSFVRFSSKDSFKRISSSKSQYKKNSFLNWASFCGSIPEKIKIKEEGFSQQRRMPKKYNCRLSGSKSAEGHLVNNSKGDQLKGWGDTLAKIKVDFEEGFGIPQY